MMKQCWPCTMYEPICTAETHGECDCPKCQGLCECDKTRECEWCGKESTGRYCSRGCARAGESDHA